MGCTMAPMDGMAKQVKVGVYGMGRFGAFWAKSLSDAGMDVAAWNRSDRPFPEGVQKLSKEEVLTRDVLFYCVAISSFEQVLAETASLIGKNTLVFDTCSVKVHPMEAMERLLPPSCRYIGTHPMFGPDSAAGGMDGLPIVLSQGRCDEELLSIWASRFSGMGLKVIETSAQEHDQEAAYTQGITHVVGRVLGELDFSESAIATSGYRQLLQVREQTCNDPLQLFMDLQHYNPYTHPMRLELSKALDTIMDLLATADRRD